MQDKFNRNINIITSTSQSSTYALAYIIGSQSAKKLATIVQLQNLLIVQQHNSKI